MLTGQAKTDYQREYMRRRRSNAKPNLLDPATVVVLDPSLRDMSGDVVAFKEGESVRDRLTRMSIAEIEAEQGFVPNWRLEQE